MKFALKRKFVLKFHFALKVNVALTKSSLCTVKIALESRWVKMDEDRSRYDFENFGPNEKRFIKEVL